MRAHRLTHKPLNFDLTPEELAAGCHQAPQKSSVYTNVSWSKARGKWDACGQLNGQAVDLERYDNESEAARACDKFAHPPGRSVDFRTDFEESNTPQQADTRVLDC